MFIIGCSTPGNPTNKNKTLQEKQETEWSEIRPQDSGKKMPNTRTREKASAQTQPNCGTKCIWTSKMQKILTLQKPKLERFAKLWKFNLYNF